VAETGTRVMDELDAKNAYRADRCTRAPVTTNGRMRGKMAKKSKKSKKDKSKKNAKKK
jgi:hypothetical protein